MFIVLHKRVTKNQAEAETDSNANKSSIQLKSDDHSLEIIIDEGMYIYSFKSLFIKFTLIIIEYNSNLFYDKIF